jgi:hypothetical protein
VHDLSEQLDARLLERNQPKIRRFDYDYKSETVYLDIMPESEFHSEIQAMFGNFLRNRLHELAANLDNDDPETAHLIDSIAVRGTANIKYKNKLCFQPDVAFGQPNTLPSLVCEVS